MSLFRDLKDLFGREARDDARAELDDALITTKKLDADLTATKQSLLAVALQIEK